MDVVTNQSRRVETSPENTRGASVQVARGSIVHSNHVDAEELVSCLVRNYGGIGPMQEMAAEITVGTLKYKQTKAMHVAPATRQQPPPQFVKPTGTNAANRSDGSSADGAEPAGEQKQEQLGPCGKLCHKILIEAVQLE